MSREGIIVYDEQRDGAKQTSGREPRETNFAVIPEYIKCPSWMGTKKGFTPLSSPSTSRRAKTIPSDGVPQGMEGGMNLV